MPKSNSFFFFKNYKFQPEASEFFIHRCLFSSSKFTNYTHARTHQIFRPNGCLFLSQKSQLSTETINIFPTLSYNSHPTQQYHPNYPLTQFRVSPDLSPEQNQIPLTCQIKQFLTRHHTNLSPLSNPKKKFHKFLIFTSNPH